MDQTNENLQRIRTLDWDRDTNPNHWRTINGSHVHLDENGNYDGGAGEILMVSIITGKATKKKEN